MSMSFCIGADALRAALADIEAAEKNGFHHCLAVFDVAQAGRMLDDCRAVYSDLIEKAHPTNPSLNWGRFQGVTRRHRFVDGRLRKIKQDADEEVEEQVRAVTGEPQPTFNPAEE